MSYNVSPTTVSKEGAYDRGEHLKELYIDYVAGASVASKRVLYRSLTKRQNELQC
jgi:hypothetical protein